ncbi:MAG TPA: Lrp/AsnC family transcriptional regulator [Thauera sp.]|jgi:DNA-binding Lrp family transcriptional regulator|uniref:siroheme decarboxylase subunit beta n=1 Tax=Thauera sp. TaxID=1905334 RepID=UPI001DE40AA7|nr:Lrp/AsnC family transcriptional regulator [Thauera sp.]MCB1946590.1 Lrp/AsnC family transcriptional regulator [Thauera sp.]MCP5223852.1 Lrp/AsnC family transcriptional regulator [Thauera sp.]HPE03024.1 Lrp/AsnC family transcriptional regulator [Thauera sp.]HRV76960.1 Lrp/AsnC family transcriptional regulator [Thauera sp.]
MPRQAILPEALDATGFRLLNEWQRDFPLEPRPFARIAQAVGAAEEDVIAAYRDLAAQGLVSRVGAVFAPRRLGASALAALAAPPERLEEVAARVTREPAINHNYQREHRYNLWFVVTAASRAQLDEVVAGIERDTGCAVIVLPLEEEFHIDLGFDLKAGGAGRRSHAGPRAGEPIALGNADGGCELPAVERQLIGALQGGLALEARPFATLAARVGLTEDAVISCIARWVDEGLIRRFGVVVRHHELGLEANAMCVWDVPDAEVSALGRRLAQEAAVTLCYRRSRVLPDWPYNLFCMIHGSAREEVLAARDDLAVRLGLDRHPHAVLFSCRRFKQTGARYLGAKDLAHV